MQLRRAGPSFLYIFEATLGFFRLTIYGVKQYFFVYIAKGLEPGGIKYLKKFFNTDSPITTNTGIPMNNIVNNKMWQNMATFVYGRMANMPISFFGSDRFISSEALDKSNNGSVNNKMCGEIRERHEYAFKKSNERFDEGMQ
jgi:hypothetical protein